MRNKSSTPKVTPKKRMGSRKNRKNKQIGGLKAIKRNKKNSQINNQLDISELSAVSQV